MRTYRTERTGPGALSVTFGLGLVAGSVAVGLFAHAASPVPTCHEDEVAAWDGQAHTVCVPIDDLLTDTITVDLDYCYTPDDERGWIWSCTVDPHATVPEGVMLP